MGQTVAIGGQQGGGPTGLTIAVEHGCRVRVTAGDFGDEVTQCIVYVSQRLAGHGFWKEDHEIDRMALVHRHADFAVMLEAADTRPMSRARINDDDRRLCLVHAIVPAIFACPRDPEQCIIGGPFKSAGIQQKLIVEIQKRRHALTFMCDHVVGVFA